MAARIEVRNEEPPPLARVRAELRAAADPAFARSVRRFFREPVEPIGVATPALRRIAGALYRDIKDWPPASRNRLLNELWKSGVLEEGNIAIFTYQRFAAQCARCEFHLFEKWLHRFVHNWGHTDGVAHYLLSACIANDPSLAAELPAWTESPNRWKRRAAAVALVFHARRGQHIASILEVAGRIVGDPDEMVQKAVGWLLKEAYPKQPEAILTFLKQHRDRAPRLVLRYAAEKMSVRSRAIVLR